MNESKIREFVVHVEPRDVSLYCGVNEEYAERLLNLVNAQQARTALYYSLMDYIRKYHVEQMDETTLSLKISAEDLAKRYDLDIIEAKRLVYKINESTDILEVIYLAAMEHLDEHYKDYLKD